VPIYEIDCPGCDRDEHWARRVIDGPDIPCECGATARKLISAPNLAYSSFETPGPSSSGSYYSKQLNQTFPSFREFERACAKDGKAVVSKDSSVGRAVVDRAAKSAASVAQDFGYSDSTEFQARRKEAGHGTQSDEENLQKKADAEAKGPQEPNAAPVVQQTYNDPTAPQMTNDEALSMFGVT